MTEITIGKIKARLNPGRVRAYRASGSTVAKAAELLVDAAVGENYRDTVPNRTALLSADAGLGHRLVRIALGIEKAKTTKAPNPAPNGGAPGPQPDRARRKRGDQDADSEK